MWKDGRNQTGTFDYQWTQEYYTVFLHANIVCTEYTNECSSQNVQYIKHITPQGKQCPTIQCTQPDEINRKQYQS